MLALHNDLGPGDRFLWFTTTGWMMWNYLVSGLLVGATPVLFDGDPGHPDLAALWRTAADEGVTFFGTSAPFLMACRKAGIRPAEAADHGALRAVGSTGAPLPAAGFEWVYEAVKGDLLLSSISGGTDVCTAFVGGCPLVPVRAGDLLSLPGRQGRGLRRGRPVGVGEQGELVVTAPMPSMPVGSGATRTAPATGPPTSTPPRGVDPRRLGHLQPDGACTITGRSDATLNRGGVAWARPRFTPSSRRCPEVADSLVVHLEDPEGGPGRLCSSTPRRGWRSTTLRRRIAGALRTQLSPRHVPDEIRAVPGVPRTLSGKKLEVPVKRILTGEDPDAAASRGSLANPEVLDAYAAFRS